MQAQRNHQGSRACPQHTQAGRARRGAPALRRCCAVNNTCTRCSLQALVHSTCVRVRSVLGPPLQGKARACDSRSALGRHKCGQHCREVVGLAHFRQQPRLWGEPQQLLSRRPGVEGQAAGACAQRHGCPHTRMCAHTLCVCVGLCSCTENVCAIACVHMLVSNECVSVCDCVCLTCVFDVCVCV